MIVYDCQQRSEEWQRLRLGMPTASEFSKIVTAKTGALSKQADSYMAALLAEWMLGAPLEDYSSKWMLHGTDMEDTAFNSYQFETGEEVSRIGFVTLDNGLVGASPDGFIGSNKILELKCPSAPVHVSYMLSRSVADEYKPQCQGLLYVCEREVLDIQSFFSLLPTVIMPVARDEEYISKLKDALAAFVEVMAGARDQLMQRFGIQPRTVVVSHPQEDGLETLGITQDDIDRIMADESAKAAKRLEQTR